MCGVQKHFPLGGRAICAGSFARDYRHLDAIPLLGQHYASPWRSAIPSLKQFRYFARIVDLGSVTRASEHLNVAQTALGSQIRQLEEELGVVLLQRHSRGVSVTKAGELLYQHVQIILADVDRCLREIAELRSEQTESLKFGASGSVVQLAASDLLARAHDAIPDVSITLVEDTSLARWRSHRPTIS
jgi:DNA-binding transcriptional LysR family regulator